MIFIEVGSLFHSAFSQYGFVYLSGHGVDEDLVEAFFDASKAFFELPEAERMKCETVNNVKYYRYVFVGQ